MVTVEVNPRLEAALAYAGVGWLVVPLHTPTDGVCDCPKKEACESPGKHPRTMHGVDDATTDAGKITSWWSIWPHANVAIDLARSGLVDIAPDSMEWWAEFTARGLPATAYFASGGGEGHLHYLYTRPEGCPTYRLTESGQYDILSAGYAVMPPSLHASGATYTWLGDIDLPADAPGWVVQVIIEKVRRRPSAGPQPTLFDDDAPPVALRGDALERWYGRQYQPRPDGSVNRSDSLWRIAVDLLEAGLSPAFTERAIAARDVALGWEKFTNRRDATERYRIITEKAVASAGSKRVRLGREPNGKADKKHEPSKGFSLVTLEEALAEPIEVTPYLTAGMLPMAGVSLWGAKPKVGKSVAVRNLGMSVSRGEPFLDRECQKGTVIYLALEEKRSEVINHFRQMGGTNEALHLHVGMAPNSSKEGLAALATIIAIYAPLLVIVDPALKLVRVRDSSDYAELTGELEPVIELARQTGCHIAVTHHLGKAAREGGDDVLGSTAIFGAVDTLVLMRRRKDQSRSLETIQRYGKDMAETVIPMDEASGTISIGDTVTAVKINEAKIKLREELVKFADDYWPDVVKLREAVALDRNVVVRALAELVDERVVESKGAGKRNDPVRYRLVQGSRSVEPQEAAEDSVCRIPIDIANTAYGNAEAPSENGWDGQGALPW